MEFLMTYGWAILVVLLAIGALAYFGVLNPGRFLPNSCVIGPGFSCSDFKVNKTDVFLTLSNGAGDDLSNVWVAVNGCLTDTGANGDDGWVDGTTLVSGVPGLTTSIDLRCTSGGVGVNGNSGSKFKKDITFSYSGSSGLTHNKTGSIVAKIE